MALAVQIGLYVVAGACLVAAGVFLMRWMEARAKEARQSYNVGKLSARSEKTANAFGAGGMAVVAVLFLLLAFFFPFGGGDEEPTAVADAPTATATVAADTPLEPTVDAVVPTSESVPTATATIATSPTAVATTDPSAPPATPTPVPVAATTTPEPTVTAEPTADLVRALVDSPVVGLYLRTGPGGEIVERLEDQAELFLTGSEQTVDGVLWYEVDATTGNRGWVAADFIAIQQDASATTAATAVATAPPEIATNTPTVPAGLVTATPTP